MMDHTRRGYKSYVPVTKWTKPQKEPKQEKQTGKDGTWEHIPLITSIPDVDKAEGPRDSTDNNATQMPRINEDIALVAAHEHDRNGGTYVDSTREKDKQKIHTSGMVREGPG